MRARIMRERDSSAPTGANTSRSRIANSRIDAPDDRPVVSRTVSNFHAELLHDEGRLLLRDLESTNGTFVADKILAKHDENYMAPEVAESIAKHVEDQTESLQGTPGDCNPTGGV